MSFRPKFGLTCQDTDAEYDFYADQIDLVVIEYPGTMNNAPQPRILARFLCEICGDPEIMVIDTNACLQLQHYGLVPQQIEMPPQENTPKITTDDMVDMINSLATDEVLTIPSSFHA